MFLNCPGSRCLGSIRSPSDLRQEPRSSPRGARVLLSSNRQLRGSGSRNGGWLSRCRHQSKSAAASLCSGLAACSCAGVEGADCRSRGVTWAAQNCAPLCPKSLFLGAGLCTIPVPQFARRDEELRAVGSSLRAACILPGLLLLLRRRRRAVSEGAVACRGPGQTLGERSCSWPGATSGPSPRFVCSGEGVTCQA